MFNSYHLRRVSITAIFLVIAALLLISGFGCGSDETVQTDDTADQEYSIADLAELAGQSVAYIEAEDPSFPDYYWFGSGFVVSADGLIITNYHVMEGAVDVIIEVNGQIYENVTVLAANEEWDLAVLKIEAAGLQPLSLAASIEQSRLGEEVVAMGNPEGFKRTVSDGIISTLYRRLDGFDFDHIQTTAPISKGSSGGPLLNMRGEVIGVNTLTYMTGQNLNFAVPIDLVHDLLNNLGQARSLAEVFGSGATTDDVVLYDPQPGEFAVVLSWEGNADLDLELWSEDYELLGTAAMLSGSPDISHGSQGEEWFVFKEHQSPGDGSLNDYSSGRYVISAYYWGPEPAEGIGTAEVELSVVFPDGRREVVLTEELWYSPPYDSWFTLLIDADSGDFKILDFFIDAPLIAMLEWDTNADLDLMVWDGEREVFYTPYDFWYGYDFRDGGAGLEIFRFGVFDLDDETLDFTTGLVDVLVYMRKAENPAATEATVTFLTETLELTRYRQTLIPDPLRDFFWVAAFDLDLETLEYLEPTDGEKFIFLED
jgi:hypothetical protein